MYFTSVVCCSDHLVTGKRRLVDFPCLLVYMRADQHRFARCVSADSGSDAALGGGGGTYKDYGAVSLERCAGNNLLPKGRWAGRCRGLRCWQFTRLVLPQAPVLSCSMWRGGGCPLLQAALPTSPAWDTNYCVLQLYLHMAKSAIWNLSPRSARSPRHLRGKVYPLGSRC